jgi:hypothetical protein
VIPWNGIGILVVENSEILDDPRVMNPESGIKQTGVIDNRHRRFPRGAARRSSFYRLIELAQRDQSCDELLEFNRPAVNRGY